MKIVLINKNPVVSKLIELSIKNTDYKIIETEDVNIINEDYDLFIIDDSCYNADMAQMLSNKNVILLTNVKTSSDESQKFKILSKPFLPTQLFNLINLCSSNQTISQESINNKILNSDDIYQIKELLEKPDMTSDNQIYEDNLSYVFGKSEETKEKRILMALLKMKPKKLKKLLADAEITFSIRFPKES
jgi:DNA-binding response OmpR family regulator